MKRLTDGGAEQRRKNRTRKCPPKIDELCRLLPLTKNKHIFVHNLVQKLAAEVLKMSIRIRIFWAPFSSQWCDRILDSLITAYHFLGSKVYITILTRGMTGLLGKGGRPAF